MTVELVLCKINVFGLGRDTGEEVGEGLRSLLIRVKIVLTIYNGRELTILMERGISL